MADVEAVVTAVVAEAVVDPEAVVAAAVEAAEVDQSRTELDSLLKLKI